MARTRNLRGEMPFLDHLEELRWHLLWSLLSVTVHEAPSIPGAPSFPSEMVENVPSLQSMEVVPSPLSVALHELPCAP